jgi:hypothetical protein
MPADARNYLDCLAGRDLAQGGVNLQLIESH